MNKQMTINMQLVLVDIEYRRTVAWHLMHGEQRIEAGNPRTIEPATHDQVRRHLEAYGDSMDGDMQILWEAAFERY